MWASSLSCERNLGNSSGFAVMEILDEHMEPEFMYTDVIDVRVLTKANLPV